MGFRKFFFDLLYVRGDFAARHPDFFYVYDEYYIMPRSLERVQFVEKNRLVTDRNEYIIRDGVLFRVPWGNGEKIVEDIVGDVSWDYLKSAGRIYFVSVDGNGRFFTVYYIVNGRFVYPARVEGNFVVQYFSDGYVSTDVEDFHVVESIDEVLELPKIYGYSFADGGMLNDVIDDIKFVKGSKIIIYPGMGIVWKGAYTLRVGRDKCVMVDPVVRPVEEPVLAISMPYLAFLIM